MISSSLPGNTVAASASAAPHDFAGRKYWNSAWAELPPIQPYQGPIFEQHAVLKKYLSKVEGRSAIEVGCVPGHFMIYLNKEFGYRVDGIDYSDKMDYVRANLECNGIRDSELYSGDFFEFVPSRKYDLVFSGGFVEHFDDYELVIQKHADLAKPGGLVVIFLPNLRYLHKCLGSLFAPEMLKVHRFQLMDRKVLRTTLEKAGLHVLRCDYHRTFRPTYELPSLVDLASRGVQKLLRMSRLDDIGNRFASPFLISVSVKN